jgi:hypothetical protein
VVRLNEIVAFRGCLPAGRLDQIVEDLRDSWAMKWLNIRLPGEGEDEYSWMGPDVAKAEAPFWRVRWGPFADDSNTELVEVADEWWDMPLILLRKGPCVSSLLSDDSFREINNDLDCICENLGLRVRGKDLRSSFLISAELPASISRFWLEEDGDLGMCIYCLGSPTLTVDWLPEGSVDRFRRWVDRPKFTHFISIPKPTFSTGAKVTLTFGEMDVDFAKVELPLVLSGEYQGLEFVKEQPALYFDIAPEKPTVPDSEKGESPNQTEPPSLAARKVPTQKPKKRRRPPDPDSDLGKRRAIVKANPKLLAPGMSVLWQNSEIPVPPGEAWKDYRPYQWQTAYKKNKKLRRRISTIVSKDKKAVSVR